MSSSSKYPEIAQCKENSPTRLVLSTRVRLLWAGRGRGEGEGGILLAKQVGIKLQRALKARPRSVTSMSLIGQHVFCGPLASESPGKGY